MPARNFLEIEPNIFFPRIDIAGEKTGITGMEFPILNYIIYLQSLVFGYTHWYGRLINLIVSSFGLFFFFKLIRKYFRPEVALHATLILLFSIWFSYSRKIMPDTFSMSLALAGLYYGTNYLDRKPGMKNLLLYFIFFLLGILSKLPTAYIGIVFLLLFFSKTINLRAKGIFSAVSAAIGVIVAVYYFYWVPYLVKTFGFSYFFMGESMVAGTREILSHLQETLEKFYVEAIKYVGFVFFVVGLVAAFIKKDKAIMGVFSLCFLSFLLLVVLKSGSNFYRHIYYIIPFVPVMALACAYGVNQIKNRRIAMAALVIIGMEGILNQSNDFHIKKDYAAILNLETDLDKVSARKDLVLINSGDFPTPMYFAHRKGWVNTDEKIADTSYISGLKIKGLKYIIILKKVFGQNMELKQTPVLSNENYDIYRL